MAAMVMRLLGLWWLPQAKQAGGYRHDDVRLEDETPQQMGARRAKDALLEQLQKSGVEDKVGRRLQEVLDSVKQQSSGDDDEDVKWLDRQEEEKIGFWVMTELEHQRWLHRSRRRHAYSLAEAQHELRRHFEGAHNTTRESAIASLMQLEEEAGSEEQAAFWRRHRSNLTDLNVLKPAVAAYACVQLDINLAYIYLPFMYVNLGMMGQLSYDFKTKCWGWSLEVSIGISGAVPLAWGLKLGLGVSLSGNWALQEVPWADTGLKAGDYTLPQQCTEQALPQLSPDGQELCHTGNPFKLVWIGLRGILGKVARSIFPFQRVTRLVDRELEQAQLEQNKKAYLKEQSARWEQYKATVTRPHNMAEAVGTDALVVTCESVRYVFFAHVTAVFQPGKTGITTKEDGKVVRVAKGSQAARLGVVFGWYVQRVDRENFTRGVLQQKAHSMDSFEVTFQKPLKGNPLMWQTQFQGFSCGFHVGTFSIQSQRVGDGSLLKKYVYNNSHGTIGAQFHESAAVKAPHSPQHRGYHEVRWSDGDERSSNMLLDASSNQQIKVVVKSNKDHVHRIEGLVEVDRALLGKGTEPVDTKLQVPVGCAPGALEGSPGISIRGCLGVVTLRLQRAEPRGTLLVQCTRASLPGSSKSKSSYCAMSLSRAAVIGRNPVWRSTQASTGIEPWWGEGTSFGVYSATDQTAFPPDGPDSIAATVSIFDAAETQPDKAEVEAMTVDVFAQSLDRMKAKRTDILLGTSTLTWLDLLGSNGFKSYEDVDARVIIKHLTKGTVYLHVAWLHVWEHQMPFEGDGLEQVDRANFDISRIAQAASGLFTAGEQFLAKLPKYSEQVLERLLDNPRTDEVIKGRLGVDCAQTWKSTFGRTKTCSLLETDGEGGARMQRQVDPKNKNANNTVYRKDEETNWVSDDRVMNLAKAARVSRNREEPEFWRELAISAANLFVRSVADIQTLFQIYFADDANWDGDCEALRPSFELPFEMADGAEGGRIPDRRYKPFAQHRLKDTQHIRLERGAKIASSRASAAIDDVEETFNPFLDHTFAYGHGYNPKDAAASSEASLRFFTPDPPQRGRLGGMHFEGYSSPTVYPHLWCNLATHQLERALRLLETPNRTAMSIRRKRSRRLQGLLSFTHLFRERRRQVRLPKYGPYIHVGYEDQLSDIISQWDKDESGNLDPQELTVAIEEACVDSEDCGDRATCEKVRLKPTFVALFPGFARSIRRFRNFFSVRLARTREAAENGRGKDARPKRLRLEETRAASLEAIHLMRLWLRQLGACVGEGRAQTAASRARGGEEFERTALCRAAESKVGMLYYEGELASAARHAADNLEDELAQACSLQADCDPAIDLVDEMSMNFHQSFAINTRLPMSLQHTAVARKEFDLIGVLWSGLPELQRRVAPLKERDEEARAIKTNLERHARARMNELAARINPQDSSKVRFPLTRTTFTLSLTAETATPGFCTPNEALLFLSWAVSGQTVSWSNEQMEVMRCFGAKVHPHNFFIQVTRCKAVLGSQHLSKSIFNPRSNTKDTETSITMLTELFDFNPDGGWGSVFSSIDPREKVLSSNFLAPAHEAAGVAAKSQMSGAAFWGLMASPFVGVAMATESKFLWQLGETLQKGVSGVVTGIRKLFYRARLKAKQNPSDPGAHALANESNGEQFVENEDPNRQSGKAFGISDWEDDLGEEDDSLADSRRYQPNPLCNSFCGGNSFWTTASGRLDSSPSNHITGFRLRADQCAQCQWSKEKCGRMEITAKKKLLNGFLCCVVRRCQEADFVPAEHLPLCSPGAKATEEAEDCCNTRCGAAGFEGGGKPAVGFGDGFFLQEDDCAQCVWHSGACPTLWAEQAKAWSKRLCCLRHPCTGNRTETNQQLQPGRQVLGWQRSQKCGRVGVAPPSWFSTVRSELRTGGTECGAVSFGSASHQYRFRDPLFLMRDQQQTHCGQCIWTTRHDSCRDASVQLEDGTVVTGLSKMHSSALSFYHLCCAKVACDPIYTNEPSLMESARQLLAATEALPADSQQPSAPDAARSDAARPRPPRVELGQRASMLARGGAAEAKGLNLMWILQVTGTLHYRHYKADAVPRNADDLTNFSRKWWTWEIHVEGWNWLSTRFSLGGLSAASPVVALNLDWDLTEAFSGKVNDALRAKYEKRLKKCLECVRNSQGYCSRKYADASYDLAGAKHEVCHSVDAASARQCNKVVGYDDYGEPTSARFIVSEAECHTMRWRKFNSGYHRHYGPTTKFRDFRGRPVMPKAPLDEWGNSQEQFGEGGEQVDEENNQENP